MDKSFLVYKEKFVQKIYLLYSENSLKKRFLIPSSLFGNIHDTYIEYFVLNGIKNVLESLYPSTFLLQYYHKDRKILIMEVTKKMKEATLIFPYEKYDEFYEVIKDINDLVSNDGMVEVFANNVIYSLEAGIFFSTSSNYEEIIEIARKNNMRIDYSKGSLEILFAQGERQYNSTTLLPMQSLEDIKMQLSFVFLLNPKSEYEKKGYGFNNFSKKRLFVSYCHKNKETVREIIDKLRSYGLDFWIDEEQIDIGDRLMERIDSGMREADLPIVFLSNATKESMYAKHELQTFFSQIIYQTGDRKNWFIVKLDDVNPNDILLGLGDFKYFDVEANDINELANSLKRKLK